MSGPVDVHTLAGAYALDALTEIERAAFARHLAGCDACAAEVAGLTEAASRLAALDAMAPPPGLRDAVMNEVYRTRQQPASHRAPVGSSERPRRSRWLAAVAAAVVGLAGIAGAWAVQESRLADERDRMTALVEQQRQINAVLTASDAEVFTTSVNGGGRVSVVLARSLGEGVVVLAGLPEPGPEKSYQLWLIDDGVPTSAGVLPAGAGEATLLLGEIRAAQTLGVTQEPAGGSAAPTAPILADLDLA
jgi:anti-sigma-K factor RskA